MSKLIRKRTEEITEEVRMFNVVVTLTNGLTTVANNIEATGKAEIIEKYAQDNLYYQADDVLSITVIEVA